MSLGHQHQSKPVTSTDKVMSERHLAHRAEIDSMPDGKAKLMKSMEYNKAHAFEHLAALKDVKKKLKGQTKAIKKSMKDDEKDNKDVAT